MGPVRIAVARLARQLVVLFVTTLVACASPTRPNTVAATAEFLFASAPRFAEGGPNADEQGAPDGYPITVFGRLPFLVGGFSHYDQLFESRTIRRAAKASPLTRASVVPALRYQFQGQDLGIDDYLARTPATGLLIARGDTIFVERYQYARNDRHRLTSMSMAKTVTAMLVGIAIAEGRIRSVDDLAAEYVPALAGTEYGGTSLRHLLQMSSGIRFIENYSGRDDVARFFMNTVGQFGPGGVEAVKPYNERLRRSGNVFSYASVETQVLGLVLRSAVERPVAEYLREKIWEPIGAEADATWIIDRSGQEATYCCLNAVLRDYARLGLLLAHDGRLGDRQVIPQAWLHEATTVEPDAWHLKPYAATRYFGYGYQTWIFPGERRMFALLGAHGQAVYVDPSSRIVMVQTAVGKDPLFAYAEAVALWHGVIDQLGSDRR